MTKVIFDQLLLICVIVIKSVPVEDRIDNMDVEAQADVITFVYLFQAIENVLFPKSLKLYIQ